MNSTTIQSSDTGSRVALAARRAPRTPVTVTLRSAAIRSMTPRRAGQQPLAVLALPEVRRHHLAAGLAGEAVGDDALEVVADLDPDLAVVHAPAAPAGRCPCPSGRCRARRSRTSSWRSSGRRPTAGTSSPWPPRPCRRWRPAARGSARRAPAPTSASIDAGEVVDRRGQCRAAAAGRPPAGPAPRRRRPARRAAPPRRAAPARRRVIGRATRRRAARAARWPRDSAGRAARRRRRCVRASLATCSTSETPCASRPRRSAAHAARSRPLIAGWPSSRASRLEQGPELRRRIEHQRGHGAAAPAASM